MTIDEQLKAFSKTDKFKMLVEKKMKTDKSVASVSRKKAEQLGNRMVEILRKKIANIKNQHGESFLDNIVADVKYDANKGWYVDISFTEQEMHRNSLFPAKYKDGIQLNIIFNEGYKASNYVYGTDSHGSNIRSKLQRDGLFFIQEAVELFNAEQNGAVRAEYSSDYSGGTLS